MFRAILFFLILGHLQGVVVEKKFVEKFMTGVYGVINYIFDTEDKNRPIELDVTFNLYTRSNRDKEQILNVDDYDGIRASNFDNRLKTVFITHGFTDHKDRDIIIDLRKEILKNFAVNVIVVDWKRLAGLIYMSAANSALKVGKYLYKFLLFLENTGADLNKVHLIGHSLGGQISGIAGGLLGGRIARITGLDPAGPYFETLKGKDKSESLDESDAKFVDVIHTSSGTFGVKLPIGHADFYPNLGISPQPGCNVPIMAISCSHVLSVTYYTFSLNSSNTFMSSPCPSWYEAIRGNCNKKKAVPMGYFTPSHARGEYYLTTLPKPPYSIENKTP